MERYSERINLRLKSSTFEAYKAAAELTGQDMTGMIRMIVEANEPHMHAIVESLRAAKAGRVSDATAVYIGLMQSALAQGQASLAEATSVFHEAEEVEEQRGQKKAAS